MFLVLALIAAEPASTAAPDPNEMICRSVGAIGSRLARQRRCATRAQWEENARNERRSTEDAQLGQTNPQGFNPGERGASAGRYVAPPARGATPN
jgi:hypothetical protein